MIKRHPTVLAASFGLAAVLLYSGRARPIAAQTVPGSPMTQLNCGIPPCDAVVRGRVAFNDRNPGGLSGNGRACADCHVPLDHFQLSPAVARARYDALQLARIYNKMADDPLFRPIDADDFHQHGNAASDFSNLVENGLVRVTMDLPPNVRLVDPATGTLLPDRTVDLWRAVMPVLNVAITGPDSVAPVWPRGPNPQGGYQHDARFSTLQEQARGALFAHAQVSLEPPPALLDDIAAFERTLFSSLGVQRVGEAILAGTAEFPDPDPQLNDVEQLGKSVFNRACAQCHGGPAHPSTSTPDAAINRPIVRYHNIQTACPHPLIGGFTPCPPRLNRNARTYELTQADGTIRRFTTSDPGRLLLTGQLSDLGVMDTTNLHGISKTAPYFHNNSAATLEEVIAHYEAFFARAAIVNSPPNLPPIISSDGVQIDRGFIRADERGPLLAYLRKL